MKIEYKISHKYFLMKPKKVGIQTKINDFVVIFFVIQT